MHVVCKTECPEPVRTQDANGFHGHDAVGSPTVSHDLPIARQFCQTAFQLIEWHGDRTGDMGRAVFPRWTDVDHDGFAIANTLQERIPIHGFQF